MPRRKRPRPVGPILRPMLPNPDIPSAPSHPEHHPPMHGMDASGDDADDGMRHRVVLQLQGLGFYDAEEVVTTYGPVTVWTTIKAVITDNRVRNPGAVVRTRLRKLAARDDPTHEERTA